jgi:hypothetical protein
MMIILVLMLVSCGQVIASEPAATLEVSPTQTVTQTPTVTAIPLPYIPMLPLEEAMVRIAELQETNGGCEYPCFWGITPGVSTVDEVWELMAPISEEIEISDQTSPERNYYFNLSDLNPEDDASYSRQAGFFTVNNIVEEIHIDIGQVLLIDLLNLLGPPEEVVYHFGLGNHRIEDPYLSIDLVYLSRGIVVGLYSITGVSSVAIDGELHLQICAQTIGISQASLTLYDVSYYLPYPDIVERILEGNRLREGMGMTPLGFYTAFANPQSNTCFIDPNLVSSYQLGN